MIGKVIYREKCEGRVKKKLKFDVEVWRKLSKYEIPREKWKKWEGGDSLTSHK